MDSHFLNALATDNQFHTRCRKDDGHKAFTASFGVTFDDSGRNHSHAGDSFEDFNDFGGCFGQSRMFPPARFWHKGTIT